MHARVVLGRVRHDKQDEAIRIYKEILVPAIRVQKGFKGMNLLTDRDTHKFISITFWETEEDMIATAGQNHCSICRSSNCAALQRLLLVGMEAI